MIAVAVVQGCRPWETKNRKIGWKNKGETVSILLWHGADRLPTGSAPFIISESTLCDCTTLLAEYLWSSGLLCCWPGNWTASVTRCSALRVLDTCWYSLPNVKAPVSQFHANPPRYTQQYLVFRQISHRLVQFYCYTCPKTGQRQNRPLELPTDCSHKLHMQGYGTHD